MKGCRRGKRVHPPKKAGGRARWRYRSADTGRFISRAAWARLPKNTTLRERVD